MSTLVLCRTTQACAKSGDPQDVTSLRQMRKRQGGSMNARGAVRLEAYHPNERCPNPGALGVCPGVGGLTSTHHRWKLTQARAGLEASMTTSKIVGLKYRAIGDYP
ncbi:hypothetical protein E2562_035145 [Oryza meyeriana var. granulata]|uniref:Uncharacterized protein n=1 Tax=Oryza meyeriana var. granulata TaxID=110450 RepID=A0A6G1F1L1_9ORYZ|nr:hypothetical protein E2562_035145 [Oryza meyeriana var. granulata]